MKQQLHRDYPTIHPIHWKGETKQKQVVLLIWSHNTIKMTGNGYSAWEQVGSKWRTRAKRSGCAHPCLGPGKPLGHSRDGFGTEAARGTSIFTLSCHPGGKQHHPRLSKLLSTDAVCPQMLPDSVCPQMLPDPPYSVAGGSTHALSCGEDQFPNQLMAYSVRHQYTGVQTLQ